MDRLLLRPQALVVSETVMAHDSFTVTEKSFTVTEKWGFSFNRYTPK